LIPTKLKKYNQPQLLPKIQPLHTAIFGGADIPSASIFGQTGVLLEGLPDDAKNRPGTSLSDKRLFLRRIIPDRGF
jgi:hypothetical protein